MQSTLKDEESRFSARAVVAVHFKRIFLFQLLLRVNCVEEEKEDEEKMILFLILKHSATFVTSKATDSSAVGYGFL